MDTYDPALHSGAAGYGRLLVDAATQIQNHTINVGGAFFADPALQYVFAYAHRIAVEWCTETSTGGGDRHDPIAGTESHLAIDTELLGLAVGAHDILLRGISGMSASRALRCIDRPIADIADVEAASERAEGNLRSRRPAKFA